jgi:23S rRNA pseudouridine1911/1915/1917 synthase
VLILHEDAHLVALGKPAGLPTHPLRPGETGTLANHLAALFEIPRDLGGPAREAGLVHRLDTLTSGLMVAARTAEAYASLRSQFREHLVEKAYLALVTGAPPDDLVVDAPIESRRGRRKVTLGRGQPAETGVTVLTRFTGLALVEARTRHGRRHQVRAHLAQAGHPLLGDPLYGPPVLAAAVPPAGPSERDSASPECVPNSPGALPLPEGPWPLLHASYLRFAHPADGRPFELRLSLPEEAEEALRKLPLA